MIPTVTLCIKLDPRTEKYCELAVEITEWPVIPRVDEHVNLLVFADGKSSELARLARLLSSFTYERPVDSVTHENGNVEVELHQMVVTPEIVDAMLASGWKRRF